jgi:hypothetical protein
MFKLIENQLFLKTITLILQNKYANLIESLFADKSNTLTCRKSKFCQELLRANLSCKFDEE